MKIAIGCDEAAYSLKVEIMKHLDSKGIEYHDFGADKGEIVLYPDVAVKVAEAVAAGAYERGILVCGTGIGMAITANKVPGIRAAVCHDPFPLRGPGRATMPRSCVWESGLSVWNWPSIWWISGWGVIFPAAAPHQRWTASWRSKKNIKTRKYPETENRGY